MDRSFRKNIIMKTFIIILLFFSAIIIASNDEEFFLRGNTYYAHHDYDNALQSYDMMSKKGRAVLYNMGNCFYHNNDYAQALVYWSRAQNGASPREYAIIVKNKKHVLNKINKVIDPSVMCIVKNFINGIVPHCSLLFLQLFLLLLCCLFVVLLSRKHNHYVRMSLICLSFVIVIIAAMLSICYSKSGITQAIVVKKDAVLLCGPDKGFHVLFPVAYAHEVVVKESREGWHKIEYADSIGWVEAGVIQVI